MKKSKKNYLKEIENINKVSELNRDKKRLMEKEEDLKRLKYNMEKAKKEEEEIAEKKYLKKWIMHSKNLIIQI